MEKFVSLLSQAPTFISSFIPYDFRKLMGQYAVEIFYTNGDKDVLTTPMSSEMGNDKGDLNEDEYFELITELKKL
tara:strand:+ start:17929 stop:18153 length:225 start_codon:yes stop_codon:yes gene_type:complete